MGARNPPVTANTANACEFCNTASAAEDTARHFGAEHTTRILTGKEVAGEIERFVDACDQPTGDGLNTLMDALARMASGERPVLVLPGYPTAHEADLRERAASEGVAADVRFPAWVSAEELEGLWALAEAFVFPSLYEGFGLPILEAMACGAPVVSSGASSLPEVGGDAALYADPHDADEFTAQVTRVLHDRALRTRMVEEGLRRARQFSWRRAAEETLAVYREVCGVAPVSHRNLNGSGC